MTSEDLTKFVEIMDARTSEAAMLRLEKEQLVRDLETWIAWCAVRSMQATCHVRVHACRYIAGVDVFGRRVTCAGATRIEAIQAAMEAIREAEVQDASHE